MYCSTSGRSSPSRSRTASSCSGVVPWLCAYMICTGSPGTRWISIETATVVTKIVKTAAKRRWTRKRAMGVADPPIGTCEGRAQGESARPVGSGCFHRAELRAVERPDLEARRVGRHGVEPEPSGGVDRHLGGFLEEDSEGVLHDLLALGRVDRGARGLEDLVELGRVEALVGARRMPQEIEQVWVEPCPAHQVHVAWAFRLVVLLRIAGI